MQAYLKLMRFHKPVGILLLWFPTAWALWLANENRPPLRLLILFFLGTILMRSAGCVINDLADRNIDGHVKRTQSRPLVTGEVGLVQAVILVLILLFCSLMILIQLPAQCFYYALFAVFITVLYPFCKRFIQGPQLVLGLAFSMGIPMAFVASNQPLNLQALSLLIINFFWILAYDTQYAMVDRDDDLRIGVKSTAILFAAYDQLIIACFQLMFHLLWLFLGYTLHFPPTFFSLWFGAIFVLLYQQKLIARRDREAYLQAFSSNGYYGLLMWMALIFA